MSTAQGALERLVNHIWYGNSILSWCLIPLSWPVRWAIHRRRQQARASRALGGAHAQLTDPMLDPILERVRDAADELNEARRVHRAPPEAAGLAQSVVRTPKKLTGRGGPGLRLPDHAWAWPRPG